MPLWASWLRDFDILNLFYDKFKSEKMAKFETLLVPRGLMQMLAVNGKVSGYCVHLPVCNLQTVKSTEKVSRLREST